MIKVTETIHHGDYHNVETYEGESVIEAFENALMLSPYNFTATLDNPYVSRCYSDLMTDGRGHYGWATYEVTS